MLKLGVNAKHEIIEYGEVTTKGLNLVEVDDETFADMNPLLFKIQTGENWQMIYPRVKVQAWEAGLALAKGQVVAYGGGLFEVTAKHTTRAKEDFTPDITPALFKSTAPKQDKQFGRPEN